MYIALASKSIERMKKVERDVAACGNCEHTSKYALKGPA